MCMQFGELRFCIAATLPPIACIDIALRPGAAWFAEASPCDADFPICEWRMPPISPDHKAGRLLAILFRGESVSVWPWRLPLCALDCQALLWTWGFAELPELEGPLGVFMPGECVGPDVLLDAFSPTPARFGLSGELPATRPELKLGVLQF